VTNLNLGPVVTAVFALEPSLADGRLQVAFSGTGDMSAIGEFNDYLTKVHDEAQRLAVSEVTCDLRRLTFMNSSCFKAFVTWIDTVKNAGQPYRIRLLADANLHWQRRSLEALRRLATSVVVVDQGGN